MIAMPARRAGHRRGTDRGRGGLSGALPPLTAFDRQGISAPRERIEATVEAAGHASRSRSKP